MNRITLKNAILYKEMITQSKRIKLPLFLFILNLIMSIGAPLFMVIYNSALASYDTYMGPQSFLYAFIVMIIFECAVMCLIIPGNTAPLITGERERQTMDVLMTTGMSKISIVIGKYFTAVIWMLLILVSTLPFLSLIFVYGGISVIQMVLVLISIIVMILYLASYGILFSCLCKKSSSANVLSLLWTFYILGGTMLTIVIIAGITGLINISNRNTIISWEWAMNLLYVNPMTTVYDALSRTLGIDLAENAGVAGMASIVSSFSYPNPASITFFVNHWAETGCVLQLAITALMIFLSSKALTPSRKVKKHGKKQDTVVS